jgi:hypothetical protein
MGKTGEIAMRVCRLGNSAELIFWFQELFY